MTDQPQGLVPLMIYDILLAGPCDPAGLAPALASAFGVASVDVDVAADGVHERNWSAPALATYDLCGGDVSYSVSITAVDGIADRPTEAVLASRVAEHLGLPVLYPAESFPPSAYWITDGHSPPARARLEYSDELDPSIEDEDALTIDAVDRPFPALPTVRVAPLP